MGFIYRLEINCLCTYKEVLLTSGMPLRGILSMLTCEEFIHISLLQRIQLMLVEYILCTEFLRIIGSPPTLPQM